MGFGLLLIGYLAANVMSYSFVPKIVGYALMMWGCVKLSDYDVKFRRCLIAAALAVIPTVYLDANKICKLLNISTDLFSKGLVNSIGLVETVLSLGFGVMLMIAIISIAKSTELDKLAFRAARNIVIMTLGEVIYIVALCLPEGNVRNVMGNCAFIIRALFVLLNLLLIFACYRMICNEGDEDMPAKEVNIPIIRKMEEVLNKRDKDAFESAKNISEKHHEKKRRKKERRK